MKQAKNGRCSVQKEIPPKPFQKAQFALDDPVVVPFDSTYIFKIGWSVYQVAIKGNDKNHQNQEKLAKLQNML